MELFCFMKVLFYCIIITALLTFFGLYRPWYAVWWSPVANRKKVLQVYGTLLILLVVIYLLIQRV